MNPKHKKVIIIFSFLAITSLAFSFFITRKITIVSSLPKNNSNITNVNTSIILEFNQKINLDNIKLTITPEESLTLTQIENTKVVIDFDKPLQINSKYSVLIFYKEKQIDQLFFTTNISSDIQYDARFLEEVQKNMDNKYPIIAKTPYNNSLYRVVYSAPLTLEITLKNPNITTEKAISDIRTWVESVGGDATAHKYIISNKPLPSTTPLSTPTPTKTLSPSPTPFNWDTLQDDGT